MAGSFWECGGVQDWLYDEGEDETKSVYTQKLEELLRLGSPAEQRQKEAEMRPVAASSLLAAAQHYVNWANSQDSKYSHISQDDRAKVGCVPKPSCRSALSTYGIFNLVEKWEEEQFKVLRFLWRCETMEERNFTSVPAMPGGWDD